MSKVYCCNCRYLQYQEQLPDDCIAPENIHKYDSSYCPCQNSKDYPTTLNQNNDCPYYKRSWWKFWVKDDK